MNAFLKEGGEYRQVPGTPGPIAANRLQGISVTPGEILNADYYVFACGPWLGKVFPFLAPIITPTRQEVFFGTAAGDQRFTGAQIPVWIDNGKHRFYGIPGNHWRGFKIAGHSHGPVIDPTTLERRTSAEGLAAARAYLRLRFPELAGAPLVETRLCQYENTTDKNLILDHHPEAGNVWIVGGGSGHGFKHGPALGEIVSDAVLALKAPHGELGLGRLLRKMSS